MAEFLFYKNLQINVFPKQVTEETATFRHPWKASIFEKNQPER